MMLQRKNSRVGQILFNKIGKATLFRVEENGSLTNIKEFDRLEDELGGLQKGDELWVVTKHAMEKGVVKRVWSLHRTTVKVGAREVDLQTRRENTFWVAHRSKVGFCCDAHGCNTIKAYLTEEEAKADFEIRKLNSRRYELEKWIDKAPIEAIREICEIKDKHTELKK